VVRIVVTGQAEHHQAAERGTVHLRVASTQDSADDAVEHVASRHAQIITQTKALVAEGSATYWSAGNVVAGACHEWLKPKPDQDAVKVLRFRAAADVRIKFRDFGALARFCVAFAVYPEIQIGSVDWALTDVRRKQLIPEVRSAAALDAASRAQAYADTLGLGPVRLVAMYEEGLRPDISHYAPSGPRGPFGGRTGSTGETAPELAVQPEDITITATVTADFDADPM